MKFQNLSDVAEILSSGIKKYNGKKHYVATGDIQDNIIINSREFSYNDRPSRANMEVKKDDVLFAKMRDTEKMFLITETEDDFLFSTGFAVLRPKTKIMNPLFLYYYFHSPYFQKTKNQYAYGGTQKSINNSRIVKIPIIVPDKKYQEKAVNILNKILNLVKKREQTKKISNDLIESIFYNIFGDPKGNPQCWKKTELCKIIEGKPLHGKSVIGSKVRSTPPGIPLLKLGALTDRGFDATQIKYYDESEKNLNGHILCNNDILISRSNTRELVGRVGRYTNEPKICLAPDLMIKIKSKSNVIDPVYLEFYLRTKFVQNYFRKRSRGTSGSMKKISNKDINETIVLVPSQESQKKFNQIKNRYENLLSQQNASHQTLQIAFSSILNMVFKGKFGA